MLFEKIDLPDHHVFHGREFPLALKYSGPSTPDSVTEVLKEKARSGYFNQLLEDHGVVVIRNLGSKDPSILAEYIKAIMVNGGDFYFEQNGAVASRTEINDTLSTANEGPSSKHIFQHNEFSRFKKYPTKLIFTCSEFAAKAGETPLVHGGELFEALNQTNAEQVKLLGKKKLFFKQIWPLVSLNKTAWGDKYCFGRQIEPTDSLEEKKRKAEKVVTKFVSDTFEWDDKDNLVVDQHTAAIRLYQRRDGEKFPTFFNSIPTFYGDLKASTEERKTTASIKYDEDREDIPTEFLDKVLQASINLAYKHKWEEGDIAIVDNFQVSHGRIPWEGTRKILVSMWDTPDAQKFDAWEG